ncbi:MAG: DUF819 family protein [Bacteroidota bacterium]
MEPVFTSDAVVLAWLMIILAAVFYTSHLDTPGWKKFYTYVPALLLCYFLPALLHWPLGFIAAHWYDYDLLGHLQNLGHQLPDANMSFSEIQQWIKDNNIPDTKEYEGHSNLYYVASRYLLPASLVLLCLSIDFKGIFNLGSKALIMFFAATLGIVIGGPIALYIVLNIAPDLISADSDQVWRGLSTVAGSWIGGGANQNAMAIIYEVEEQPIFPTMIVVDVIVANIWMGFLLYGANISESVDRWLKADSSAIEDLKESVAAYRASIAQMPTTTSLFLLMAVAFGAVGVSHWGADTLTPLMKTYKETLDGLRLNSLMSHFFWLIVISTTIGLVLSFTRARKLEGVGASTWGSIFIYVLVATIGMKMNIGEIFSNLGLFAIGIIWMLVHVSVLLITAKLIKAPFFFVAVGSQANVGGAASAPVVASAFSPSLAPVGVLMAVLGYALGTYGALICAEIMRAIAGG